MPSGLIESGSAEWIKESLSLECTAVDSEVKKMTSVIKNELKKL